MLRSIAPFLSTAAQYFRHAMPTLPDFMLPAPLGPLIGLLLGFALEIVSQAAGIRIFRRRDAVARGLYFAGGMLSVAWITLLLALCGFAAPQSLRLLGLLLTAAALIPGWQRRATLIEGFRRFGASRERIWFALLAIVLLVVALSPPTDADSLDYHLGVPVEVLRSARLDFDPMQLHYRMFGFGEMLNLFGLGNGAASFGALIQLLAVFHVLAAYRECAPDKGWRPGLVVLGIPALIALLPGCKHLLTGASCTTLAFMFLFREGRMADRRSLLLPLLAILLAVGIKYSFFISGSLLLAYGLLLRRSTALRLLPGLLLAGALSCGPLFVDKIIRFGDPAAPFLAALRGDDPVVRWLGAFIRDYRESDWPFPLSLLLPSSPGALSSVLGWGLVLLLFAAAAIRRFRAEVTLVLVVCAATVVVGQRTSRFFIEPLLWAIPVLMASGLQRSKGMFIIGQLQFAATLPLVLYLAWSLGRGILSPGLEARVMRENGSFYGPAAWVNRLVPHDALLRTDIRSRSLLAMPVFPIEYHYARNAGQGALQAVDSLLARRYDVAYIAVIDPDKWFVQKYCGALVAGPKTFTNATRNPFNRGTYSMVIYEARP